MIAKDEFEWREGSLDCDPRCVIRDLRLPLPFLHFNPTLFWDGERLRLLARYQRGGSRLFQCELSGLDYTPGPLWQLDLSHPLSSGGQEDPRVFAHAGRWHVAFAGVQCLTGTTGDGVAVHQLVARLNPDGTRAEEIWRPEYPRRNQWEKNHGFFSYSGELFSIYTIKPWTVFHHHAGNAYPFGVFDWQPRWVGGWMRGGAAPVPHNRFFYSFFHGKLEHAGYPYATYSMGAVRFQGQPPFRPLAYTPLPILLPPAEGWPRDLGVSVVFPGGAYMIGGKWVISTGVHDSWCHIVELDPELLERSMVAV